MKPKFRETIDLTVAPARVKRIMEKVVNHHVSSELAAARETVLLGKKAGITKPEPPAKLPKGATPEQAAAHKEARDRFKVELQKYNKYKNGEFGASYKHYTFCRKLNSLVDLLSKPKITEHVQAQIDDLKAVLTNTCPPQELGESDADYEKRAARYTKNNYKEFSAGLNLDDAEALKQYVAAVKEKDAHVKELFHRDEIAQERFRFGDTAAVIVACAVEQMLTDIVSCGLENTHFARKKTMQPHHCILTASNKAPLAPLFVTLPHYLKVVERAKNKDAWQAERDRAEQQFKRRQKALTTKHKFEYPSFGEVEVAAGRAVATTIVGESGKKRYQWLGIEIDEEGTQSSMPFQLSVSRICAAVLRDASYYLRNTIISSNTKKFLADLAVDLIVRITSLIKIVLDINEGSLITESAVKAALKMILVDSYPKLKMDISLSKEHTMLFEFIDAKLQKLAEYRAGDEGAKKESTSTAVNV